MSYQNKSEQKNRVAAPCFFTIHRLKPTTCRKSVETVPDIAYSEKMQIEIKLDESCKEPKIIIHTDKMTEEVSQIVKLLSEEKPEVFAAIHENGEIILLEQTEIIRIYAENDRVYAKTKDGSYRLKARLYELEERLNKKMFIRISNSEIINLKEVKKFDLSFSGTICVSMSDKTATYVSRRYVRKIKQVLGL